MQEGHGDLVAMARGAIANPDWPNRLRDGRPFDDFEPGMINPKATIENTDAFLARRRLPRNANGALGERRT